MAVVKTCETLRKKICERGAEYLGCSPDDVEFDGEKVVNLKTKEEITRKRNRKQSNVQQQRAAVRNRSLFFSCISAAVHGRYCRSGDR